MNHRKNEIHNINNVRLLFGLLGLVFLVSLSLVPTGAGAEDISETRVIPAESFLVYSFEMQREDRLHVEFEVITGETRDISVYAVNSLNFERLRTGYSFSSIKKVQHAAEARFWFEAPSNDTYYVVFRNFFSAITVEIEIEYIRDNPLKDILTILFLGGSVAIAGIFVTKNQMKKAQFVGDFPHHRAPVRTPPNKTDFNAEFNILPQHQPRFCTECGHVLGAGTHFCSNCGQKQ